MKTQGVYRDLPKTHFVAQIDRLTNHVNLLYKSQDLNWVQLNYGTW